MTKSGYPSKMRVATETGYLPKAGGEEVVGGESRKPETESETMPGDLIVNPNFWLVPSSSRVGGQVTSVTIMAPVKGRGASVFFFIMSPRISKGRLERSFD